MQAAALADNMALSQDKAQVVQAAAAQAVMVAAAQAPQIQAVVVGVAERLAEQQQAAQAGLVLL